VDGYAGREPSEDFEDHHRKATVFWHGLSVRERAKLVDCARLEIGKVESGEARRRAIAQLHRVDEHLARRVAKGLYYPRGAGEVEPIDLWR
jgi:catalase